MIFLLCFKKTANYDIQYKNKSKVVFVSRGQPESSLFNSYYTEVSGRVLILSLDCSTLPFIHTLYCWVLSKEVSSTNFKVFGMMQPEIEPRSPGPLANTWRQLWLILSTNIDNNSILFCQMCVIWRSQWPLYP